MQNTNTYPKLRSYMRQLGVEGQIAYAKACGTSVGYIRKFLSRGCELGADKLAAMVIHSKGQVPAEELCPTVNWKSFARAALSPPRAMSADPKAATAKKAPAKKMDAKRREAEAA